MALSFKQLREVIKAEPGKILSLGEDEDGGIKIVNDYGKNAKYSVDFVVAKGNGELSNPDILFIKAL